MVCRGGEVVRLWNPLFWDFKPPVIRAPRFGDFRAPRFGGMQKQPFRVASRDFVAFLPLMGQEKQHKLPLFPFWVAFWQPYLL